MRKISTKLFLISLASIFLTALVVLIPALVGTTQIIDELAREDMQSSMKTIESVLDRMRSTALGASIVIAQNADTADALKRGDEQGLAYALNALLSEITIFSKPDFVTLTDANGAVLLRTHSAEVGDNITHRRSVARALNRLHTSDIEPNGESALGITSTVPIIVGDMIVGTVSVGYDMGLPNFVDYLKYVTNAEITVFAYDVSIMTTIVSVTTGERSYGVTLAPHIAAVVLGARESFHRETEIAPRPGEVFLAYYKPFLDETGEVLGLVFAGQNLTAVRAISTQATMLALGFAAIVVVVVFLVSRYFNNKIIVRPVKLIIQAVTQLSEGKLQVTDIASTSKDEFGELSSSTKKMAEAIIRQQQLYEANPIPAGLWLDGPTLIDCNHAAVELLGLTDKHAYIDNFLDFQPETQPCGTPSTVKFKQLYTQAFKEGYVRNLWLQRHANGEPIPGGLTLVRLDLKDTPMVAAYLQDLRPLREASEKIREAEEESRAKSRFLARMSHEIRTPMNAVLGTVEIMLQKESLPQDVEDAFWRIRNSSHLLLAIINDILDLSKVEAGKMEVAPHSYETGSLIVDTVQLNLMHMGDKDIEFKLRISELLPTHLFGDELRIKQILNNLLSNAFKYTEEGMVTLSFDVDKTPEEPEQSDIGGHVLVLRVIDTGQGMTQEQADNLFSGEFTRFNIQSNHAIEGSGLGMSIAYQLIKLMDGNISVKSKPGVGTRFTVRIPQRAESTDVLGKEAVENMQNLETIKKPSKKIAKLVRQRMPHGKVLVVDDVESNLYVARGLLMPYKMTVDTAKSGAEAIAKIKDGKVFDIIFMDHMMPEMDGLEAAKIMRALGYNHPIIALTANTVRGQEELFMQNGFSGFISKPIDPHQLDEYLLRFVGGNLPG
ncbi:MAG: ATP-binding protein [Oscillospiraceae bacterium]|nr:ATP-binding protein [Oscillospiraceae bacterium]